MKLNKPYLQHILDESKYIIGETESLEYEGLIENETLKRACIRSLEIIGEASKNLSDDFRNSYPKIEWKEMMGLRYILINKYFDVK